MKVKILDMFPYGESQEDYINNEIEQIEQEGNTILDIKYSENAVYYNDNSGGKLHTFKKVLILYQPL